VPHSTHKRFVALLPAALVAAALASPASAPAAGAPFTCEASAFSGSILGQPPVEPVTANRGEAACKSATAGGTLPLTAPLSTSAVNAITVARGTGPTQAALAAGGLLDLRVAALPDLGITLPTAQIPEAIRKISLNVPLLGAVTVDLGAALEALAPGGKLPNVDLVSAQALYAYAVGSCANGKPVTTGQSSVAGVRILGQDVGTDTVLDQVLTLINTGSIDPSDIDLTKVTLPPVLQALPTAQLTTILQTLLKPALDALPTITIPATLAQVQVTPGTTVRDGETLTQTAARVHIAIANQPVADLTIGRATVGAAGVDCSVPARTTATMVKTAAELALECTTRKLVLTDVVKFGDHVLLIGAADRRYAGRTVDLRFEATGARVAQAKVRADGTFQATAPLPPRKLRGSNRARYRASVGKERSLNLKLGRRMRVTNVKSAAGKVTIAGRITRPLAKPAQRITLTRRVTCKRSEVVKRFMPKADGTFEVTTPAPAGKAAAVYRLRTSVRKTTRNPKMFPTFTLPRAVELK
jgi:hypothetical protein